MRLRNSILFGALALAGMPAAHGGVPAGGEFQVDSYEYGYPETPRIATDASGSFVVVWRSVYAASGDYVSVQARRFAADGTPAGEQFQVNTETSGNQWMPDAATIEGGDFVVVWADHEPCAYSGFCGPIKGQRLAPDGSHLGDEFEVSEPTVRPMQRYYPRVAGGAAGGFVVVWQSAVPEGPPADIHGRRFSPRGLALGEEFKINSHPVGAQSHPAVAGSPNGFVVVWQGTEQDGDEAGVFGQRLATDGTSLGGEFAVNSYTANSQREPAVAADGSGNFLVVWQSRGGSGHDPDVSVEAQRFDADGSRLGGQFQINTYSLDSQEQPDVTVFPSGEVAVVWASWGSPGSDREPRSILGQRLTPAGGLLGDEFQVNSYTTGNQRGSAIASSADGRFVVVWSSDIVGIRGQRFAPEAIFFDGFESGDTAAWSGAVP